MRILFLKDFKCFSELVLLTNKNWLSLMTHWLTEIMMTQAVITMIHIKYHQIEISKFAETKRAFVDGKSNGKVRFFWFKVYKNYWSVTLKFLIWRRAS